MFTTPPKVLVNKILTMKLPIFSESSYFRKYTRLSFETWIRCNLGWCKCFVQVSDYLIKTGLCYDFFCTEICKKDLGGHCPTLVFIFFKRCIT